MGEVIRLGSGAQVRQRPAAAPAETLRRGLLIAALTTVITLSLGVIAHVSWPRTPPNIVAGPATPDVSDDSAVFDPKVAEEQQQVRLAEQERENSAVFGQAPSAPEYQTPPAQTPRF